MQKQYLPGKTAKLYNNLYYKIKIMKNINKINDFVTKKLNDEKILKEYLDLQAKQKKKLYEVISVNKLEEWWNIYVYEEIVYNWWNNVLKSLKKVIKINKKNI